MENSPSQSSQSPAESTSDSSAEWTGQAFYALMDTIVARRDHPSPDSYTSKLLAGGDPKIGSKIIEEAAEVIDAAVRWSARKDGLIQTNAPLEQIKEGTENHLVYESADLIYHLLVMLAYHRIDLQQVEAELARRFGVSGLAEKASRPK